MNHLHTPPSWRCSWRCDRGLEAVEMALIAALVLGGLLIILPQFSTEMVAAYSRINDALASAMGG